MKGRIASVLVALVWLTSFSALAFAPVSRTFRTAAVVNNNQNAGAAVISQQQHPLLQRQRHSVAGVQTMGLFGLGAPEIAIILIAAAFLLGPQKLAELGKDAGKIAGELKEVPKEFQAGLKEGEKQALETKSKIIEDTASVTTVETVEKKD
jgi:sec-independent protein translocase protein TatA